MNVDKKWIEKMRNVMSLVGLILCFLMTGGCGSKGNNTEDMENTWQKQSATEVVSQTYTDMQGNTITYYCCKTTYYGENAREESANGGLDRSAIETVIPLEQAVSQRACMVGEWPALLCEWEERSYLCWTISPEYSCVIEYDATAVAEADIFRMAESVVQK